MIRYNNLYNIHYVCLLPIVYQNMRTINFLTSYPEEKYRHTLKTITRNITKYNKITNNYIINVFHEHRRPLFYSQELQALCFLKVYTPEPKNYHKYNFRYNYISLVSGGPSPLR